jgi:hypothetical protein
MPEFGKSDIVIKIHLSGTKHHASKTLIKCVDTIETALYASDRKDIEQATTDLHTSRLIRDASLERLRQYRNNRLLFFDAKSGSIELFAIVAGVSYFVLKQTIGESVKEGFKESEVGDKLKELIKKQINSKALFITESLRRVFETRKETVDIKLLPPSSYEPNQIIIDISEQTEPKYLIGSISEELDK